jgi:hypothetical protein
MYIGIYVGVLLLPSLYLLHPLFPPRGRPSWPFYTKDERRERRKEKRKEKKTFLN